VKTFELIEIEGQAYERGRAYGARAAVAIQRNIEAYLRLIEFRTGMDREAILEVAGRFGPVLEEHASDLLSEMHGIAEGAARDLVEILLVNARSELLRHMDECTALAAAPEVTAQGDTLMGQNWDWNTSVEAEPVLLRIRQPGKPEILTLAEAGQVAKIGINSAGLGVGLNFLSHTDQGHGLPIHVILRLMLGCASLGEAVREAYHVPRGGAANVPLAHAEGEILDLELTSTRADYIYGDGGWLVHANHFESTRLRDGDSGMATSMSTLARAARARRLLSTAAANRNVTIDTFRTILADHAYGAYAICRHADPSEPPLERSATRASLIMDLGTRTMYVAAGQPCRQQYEALAIPSVDQRASLYAS
jgi:isopenicillin-N N-acyltransferase-like protein